MNSRCDSLNLGITKEAQERNPKRFLPLAIESNKVCAGLRYNASSNSISEGLTNALAFANREGASIDLIEIDFVSYSTLVNELGAKVQYVMLEHDEVEVAFEAIHFHSAYGKIPVMADRSVQPQSAWCLTTDTWKLRTLGKAPHILTYGEHSCPAQGELCAA